MSLAENLLKIVPLRDENQMPEVASDLEEVGSGNTPFKIIPRTAVNKLPNESDSGLGGAIPSRAPAVRAPVVPKLNLSTKAISPISPTVIDDQDDQDDLPLPAPLLSAGTPRASPRISLMDSLFKKPAPKTIEKPPDEAESNVSGDIPIAGSTGHSASKPPMVPKLNLSTKPIENLHDQEDSLPLPAPLLGPTPGTPRASPRLSLIDSLFKKPAPKTAEKPLDEAEANEAAADSLGAEAALMSTPAKLDLVATIPTDANGEAMPLPAPLLGASTPRGSARSGDGMVTPRSMFTTIARATDGWGASFQQLGLSADKTFTEVSGTLVPHIVKAANTTVALTTATVSSLTESVERTELEIDLARLRQELLAANQYRDMLQEKMASCLMDKEEAIQEQLKLKKELTRLQREMKLDRMEPEKDRRNSDDSCLAPSQSEELVALLRGEVDRLSEQLHLVSAERDRAEALLAIAASEPDRKGPASTVAVPSLSFAGLRRMSSEFGRERRASESGDDNKLTPRGGMRRASEPADDAKLTPRRNSTEELDLAGQLQVAQLDVQKANKGEQKLRELYEANLNDKKQLARDFTDMSKRVRPG